MRHTPSAWYLIIVYSVLVVALYSCPAGALGAQAPTAALPVTRAVALPHVMRGARSPFNPDPVAAAVVDGTWTAPHAGETVALPDGATRTWTALTAGKDGWFTGPELRGGYLDAQVQAPAAGVYLFNAPGDGMAYVNGAPEPGDPYAYGYLTLPVRLHAGANDFLVNCAAGRLRLSVTRAATDLALNPSDTTLPDLRPGIRRRSWAAIPVINATGSVVAGALIRTSLPGGGTVTTEIPALTPCSVRKVGFLIPPTPRGATGTVKMHVALLQRRRGRLIPMGAADVPLRVRTEGQTYKATFISGIDGSVQYYAVNPAIPVSGKAGPAALVLTLHGAGVEAIGQADAYEPKTWADIVAPTNRRPFGFDWEQWGAIDALEVLHIAESTLDVDPSRTYLTGHSMGGHGTWQVGVTYPGLFAAIGPSAGWISFQSYVGVNPPEATPVEQMLARADSPSDTLALGHNYAQLGIYILQGGADDNVPPTEARAMAKYLSAFHHDFVYHEQPGEPHWWGLGTDLGTDCVDWAQMFDLFARHRLPSNGEVRHVNFSTANPGLSATDHWLTIAQQQHPLEVSTADVWYDTGKRRLRGTTTNVSRMCLDLSQFPPGKEVALELDGGQGSGTWPTGGQLWLARSAAGWIGSAAPGVGDKRPDCSGPFKQAYQRNMIFVYGTGGSAAERRWAYRRARFDAETFLYRGNGSVDIIPDTAFQTARTTGRNVILYGNADTNGAWSALLGAAPIQVREGAVTIGDRHESGGSLACLFVYPRPGPGGNLVAAVSGTGVEGMRLSDRLPVFVSGVAYPDWTLFGPSVLARGASAVRGAGFFSNSWQVAGGDEAWRGDLAARR